MTLIQCIFIYGQKSHPDLKRLQQVSVNELYEDDLFANVSGDFFGDYWASDTSSGSQSGFGGFDLGESGNQEIEQRDADLTVLSMERPQDHFLLTKHILLYIMMAIGVPANFLILFVSFSNRKKLPSSSWLVINLALSDFLLLLSVPLEVSR